MNDCTTTVYVVEGRAWWGFSAKEWIAFFPLAIAGMRSGEGYELPGRNRLRDLPRVLGESTVKTLGTRIEATPKSSTCLAGI